MFIDPEELETRLREEFGGTSQERRVVVRQAVDLADSSQYRENAGTALTTALVVSELSDAPYGTPADRWNWWIGSLDLAYGGFARFRIDRFPAGDRET
ncbi:hypothetical protein [Halobiforma nitratireducens]|uniref:Uncharacterized protein n=1 Tax=Halobiforma nitratireducens JCM 10879 TaxID=1227454 RepID=M0LFR4_9EURY|nr:hypothetical protein [Halobiforma nitratireducens]EMA32386.1 hypothetical protein C446_14779 [Halobiforma nitratireducens JCM 10879]